MSVPRGTSMHAWTGKRVEWLRANAGGVVYAELAARFNKRWRARVSAQAVKSAMGRYGIRSGLGNGRFTPGRYGDNLLRKGEYYAGCERTWLKKGNRPHNAAPVGTVVKTSECAGKKGYLKIKVGEPHSWEFLHKKVWEALNGPVPEGGVVIFGDGNQMNLSPSNLLCVSRAQLAVMNRMGLIYGAAELTRQGALIASVKIAARRRKPELCNNVYSVQKHKKRSGANVKR